MKALVLNGISDHEIPLDSICDALVNELECRGWHTSTIILRQTDIADCKGCFSCWHCTPGNCVIEDYGRELAGKIINSGLFVVVTPVRFGGFSYDAKKKIKDIQSQVKQAFEHPSEMKTIFEELPISKVYIVLVGELSQMARKRLNKELRT